MKKVSKPTLPYRMRAASTMLNLYKAIYSWIQQPELKHVARTDPTL